MADALIAPVDVGIAKYQRIVSLPASLYFNRILSVEHHLHGHLHNHYREHARAARHLLAELVMGIAVEGIEAIRSNFELDWWDLETLASEHFKGMFLQSKAAEKALAVLGCAFCRSVLRASRS